MGELLGGEAALLQRGGWGCDIDRDILYYVYLDSIIFTNYS